MLEPLPAADHVLAFRLRGEASKADIEDYSARLDALLEAHDAVSLYIDLTGWSAVEAGAVAEGIKADLDFLRHRKRFHRCAIVADKAWMRAVTDAAGRLLPGVELKAFSPDEATAARTWADTLPVAVAGGGGARSGLRLIKTSEPAVLGVEIDGRVSVEAVQALIPQVEAFFSAHPRVRVLARVRSLAGVDPSVVWQSGLLSMKRTALAKVERYAVVGAPGWMKAALKTLDPLLSSIEMRAFEADDEAEAWAWLGAQPAT